MVILYIPLSSMAYRMVTLVVYAFGFSVCYTLAIFAGGLLLHLPWCPWRQPQE